MTYIGNYFIFRLSKLKTPVHQTLTRVWPVAGHTNNNYLLANNILTRI